MALRRIVRHEAGSACVRDYDVALGGGVGYLLLCPGGGELGCCEEGARRSRGVGDAAHSLPFTICHPPSAVYMASRGSTGILARTYASGAPRLSSIRREWSATARGYSSRPCHWPRVTGALSSNPRWVSARNVGVVLSAVCPRAQVWRRLIQGDGGHKRVGTGLVVDRGRSVTAQFLLPCMVF